MTKKLINHVKGPIATKAANRMIDNRIFHSEMIRMPFPTPVTAENVAMTEMIAIRMSSVTTPASFQPKKNQDLLPFGLHLSQVRWQHRRRYQTQPAGQLRVR